MLTPHQQEKLEESLDLLKVNDRLLIKGSAGVGKTFMVNELVKRLMPSTRGIIYCAAPTNKAVSVVKSKVEANKRIVFITTHAALKMKRHIDSFTGNISFRPSYSENYPPLKGVGLFIIDEASMVDTNLLTYIEQFAERYNVKVIFIGDIKQLNPVGEENSPVFEKDYPEVELLEIIRQGEGNPIIDLSRNLKDIYRRKSKRVEDLGFIYSNDYERVIITLAEVNGTSDLKYLAWTNKEVDGINKAVRTFIYGDNPRKIEEGELLIFNEPYRKSFFTNEELLVENFKIEELSFQYPSPPDKVITDKFERRNIILKCYTISPKNKEKVLVIHEDSEEDYKKVLKHIKKGIGTFLITWKHYFEFKEKFADLKYGHAITVHKSQGSTYKQVIVNIQNINRNRSKVERQRMLYTAVTRAAELLVLYKV